MTTSQSGPTATLLPLTEASFEALCDVYAMELQVLHGKLSNTGLGGTDTVRHNSDNPALLQRLRETEYLCQSLHSLSRRFRERSAGVPVLQAFSGVDRQLLALLGFDTTDLSPATEERVRSSSGGELSLRKTNTMMDSQLQSLQALQKSTALQVAQLAENHQLLQQQMKALVNALHESRPVPDTTAPSQVEAQSSSVDLPRSPYGMPAAPQQGSPGSDAAPPVGMVSPSLSMPEETVSGQHLPLALSPRVSQILVALGDPGGGIPDLSALSREELLELKAATTIGAARMR